MGAESFVTGTIADSGGKEESREERVGEDSISTLAMRSYPYQIALTIVTD